MMNVEIISYTRDPLNTIAKAASVCYRSEPNLNIVKQCIKSGHCYDDKTEVLTERGFIKWSDVDYNTKIANIDPKTRKFVGFKKPLLLISYQYDGKMINFNNKYVDLTITPEHKLYCSLSNSAYNRIYPSFDLIQANKYIECCNKRFNNMVYKKPLRMATSAINSNLEQGNPIYKLYGFFIGDGYCKTDKTKIYFHLKKERKINYLKQICNECNLTLEEKQNNNYSIQIYNFRSMFYNTNNEKTFPNEFLSMSKENFSFFLEGLINSDGYIQKTSMRYDTTSEELKDKISALFAINDTVFTVCKKINNNKNQKDSYSITISLRNKYPMFNDSRSKKYASETNYSGMVYCAEVDTGLIIVRKNDKVVLCGNCSVLEHCSFTFMVSGIDRNLTHQLVRHRIASYSQESQRYVDMSNNEFVYPQAYGRESTLYEKSFYHSMKCYEDLIELGAAKEDARSVLPGACETRIVITMNLRSLAHFMNERLCMRAQEPIRKLANAMKQAVLNVFEKTEEKEIIRKLLVPKCEIGELHFCPEVKTCNRHKTAKEISNILSSIEKEKDNA